MSFSCYKRNRQIIIKDKLKYIEIAKIKRNIEGAKIGCVLKKSIQS